MIALHKHQHIKTIVLKNVLNASQIAKHAQGQVKTSAWIALKIMLDGEVYVSKKFLYVNQVNILSTIKVGVVYLVQKNVKNVFTIRMDLFADLVLMAITEVLLLHLLN